MIILGVLLFSVSGAWGQGITFEGKPRWGFNNTVVLQRINRLSVLVANNTGEAFDGTITLQKEEYLGSRLGARLVQPVYLNPFTQRWVHFLCYVANEHEEWKLRIGRGLLPSTYLPVEGAKAGSPVRMFLHEAGSAVGRRFRMQSFPDDEFPTSLTGLEPCTAWSWHTPRNGSLPVSRPCGIGCIVGEPCIFFRIPGAVSPSLSVRN